MLTVAIGSQNKTKVEAVKRCFQANSTKLISLNVPSGVGNQPFSDEETLQGAMNRAKAALHETKADIGIGLEGGVSETKAGMLLCNWGALYTKDHQMFSAAGARIMLPVEVAEELRKGRELAQVMEDYAAKKDVRSQEGAIGIFTNERVIRKDMFAHVVNLLVGQYEYHKKQW